jgi:protein tyrosine phosphatase (PTP) superfamily phosphohydrolase (DUF442 family)
MSFNLSFRNVILFAFIWLCIGFAIGATTLLGPVRWIANFSRSQSYSDNTEGVLIKAIIVLFVISSFFIARLIAAKAIKTVDRKRKWIIPAVSAALATIALLILINPKTLSNFSAQQKDTSNAQFTFGSYPSKDDLENLKQERYTSVISLLHPAVTPFEPTLLKEEQELCKDAGITLISIPMLPWVSENEEAINKIKQIAANPSGKYYVHCYLGKDRVNLVKRLINSYSGKATTEKSGSSRSLSNLGELERGPVTTIGNEIFFTPYPTDEEYMGYVISAGVQQVISLMDSTDPEQVPRIEAERKLLATYNIPFVVIPVPGNNRQKQLNKLKVAMRSAQKPLVIHHFFSNSQQAVAIIGALKK